MMLNTNNLNICNEDFKIFGGNQPDNFLTRVNQALTRPIQSRCAELAVLFDRGSIKDFHSVFRFLIDNIFGPRGTINWELRSITSSSSAQDFQAIQHFLSPTGPMFKVICTLLKDPLLKYDFSLAYLPKKVRESLNGSMMHPFYADLVNIDHQTDEVISLCLNPFDYYFFHFAYHLINPFHQRSFASSVTSWNTVYYVLCCDYMLHFLPTNPLAQVLPILTYYNGKNPVYVWQPIIKNQRTSKLLRNDIQNMNRIQSTEHHPRNEIWRSETIMTVFIDMWLDNDQVLCMNQSFDRFNSPFTTYNSTLHLNELPTGEYIRIIRVLVKQLHAFSSSARVDDSHMGELKKIVIPYLQGRMYIFLRHLIHRWPLDGSFRLILELWVSFLQPWRYPGTSNKSMNQEVDLEDTNIATSNATLEITKEHLPFVSENLLAYTVLLQQLLPRFSRVDLSSPKIALILYRLTKVFAQPNLVSYLRQIEKCTESYCSAPLLSYSSDYGKCNLPPLSPTSAWSTNPLPDFGSNGMKNVESNKWNQTFNLNETAFESKDSVGKWDNIVKQKILELEGPHFCYKQIFCAPPAREVFELLQHIKRAETTAQNIISTRLEERKAQTKGFFKSIKAFFLEPEYTGDEFTLEERKKVPTYLQLSLQNLKQIFEIEDINYSEQKADDISVKSTIKNDIGYMLTPRRVRERVLSFKYEGDPDLAPIRTDEIKVFVRLLYQLALKINQDFGGRMRILYGRNDFCGRLSRQILEPPLTVYKFDKTFPGYSPRVPHHLPPRLSLRYFASQRFLFYLAVVMILSKFFGFGYFTFSYVIILFWIMYLCLKAVCDSRQENVQTTETSMEVDNSTGNDSF